MSCSITALIAVGLIISMIYFQNATSKSNVVLEYKKQLPVDLQNLYDKIVAERMSISYSGYIFGLILSFVVIIYQYDFTTKRNKLSNVSLVSLVVIVSFFTNYFYYMLTPKTNYMLDNLNTPEQTKAWLIMYKEMLYNYHLGMVIGIIAMAVLALAFRC